MVEIPCIQNSPEWHTVKIGVPSASNFHKILSPKGKVSDQRKKYMYELAGEIISKRSSENYVSWRMEKAKEMEAESRMVYEMRNEVDVRQVGFVFKDERRMYGCSPDGLIDPNGGFETKDANFSIQIERLLAGEMVDEHIPQVQGCLLACEREWWDFQSYCNGLEPLTIRNYRDEKYIKTLSEELERFCFELAGVIKKLKALV